MARNASEFDLSVNGSKFFYKYRLVDPANAGVAIPGVEFRVAIGT
jgi:hypothetical protein